MFIDDLAVNWNRVEAVVEAGGCLCLCSVGGDVVLLFPYRLLRSRGNGDGDALDGAGNGDHNADGDVVSALDDADDADGAWNGNRADDDHVDDDRIGDDNVDGDRIGDDYVDGDRVHDNHADGDGHRNVQCHRFHENDFNTVNKWNPFHTSFRTICFFFGGGGAAQQ